MLNIEPSIKAVLRQQAQDAKGPPSVIGWTESTHFLEDAIHRVVLKEADPQQELRKVNEELARYLK
jgi:hypothetical protein